MGFAALWYVAGPDQLATRLVGLLAAVISLTTVYCTAMIYASLKPIRQWHNKHTAPDYLLFALFSGAALLAALVVLWTGEVVWAGAVTIGVGIAAGVAKTLYWRFIDGQAPLTTLASATGLAAFGTVTPLDQPHFTENYILREMGYQVARKHAAKLRRIALLVAFVLPCVLALLAVVGGLPMIAAPLAVLCAGVGLFIERWLFFAEATHVSTIYYGRAV